MEGGREEDRGRGEECLQSCDPVNTHLLQILVSSVAHVPTPMDPSPANVQMASRVFAVSTAPSAKHNRHVPPTSPVLPR